MTSPDFQKIPEAIVQLQHQLDQFRSTNPRRTKLPESVWESAVGLASQYGIWQTAKALRLDYMGLKKRLLAEAGPRRKPEHPTFVELVQPRQAQLEEYMIELESSQGAKMRIQWKASAAPDWMSLLRAWREMER
jgi:hypothetical protein